MVSWTAPVEASWTVTLPGLPITECETYSVVPDGLTASDGSKRLEPAAGNDADTQ